MEVPPAEIIDRLTIVRLKIENNSDPEVIKELRKELGTLKQALEDFKREGIKIKQKWVEELYNVNKEEWLLLEEMDKERKKQGNFEKIGKLYLETEKVNKKRAEIKNRVVEETGKGFKEIKKNHPSE